MLSLAIQSKTKDRIIDAAVALFNTKGFNGTSVRDISQKAKVNVANIAYYFENKEGLLEHLVTTFLEGYIQEVEAVITVLEEKGPTECLYKLIQSLLRYHHEHRHIARFVYREISLDTVLIREIMTTYLTKEKYYLKMVFEQGMKEKAFKKLNIPYVILQLKGMLSMPYLHPQYLAEVLHVFSHETFFIEQYKKELENWVHQVILEPMSERRLYVKMSS